MMAPNIEKFSAPCWFFQWDLSHDCCCKNLRPYTQHLNCHEPKMDFFIFIFYKNLAFFRRKLETQQLVCFYSATVLMEPNFELDCLFWEKNFEGFRLLMIFFL